MSITCPVKTAVPTFFRSKPKASNGAIKINFKGESVTLSAKNPGETNLTNDRDKLAPRTGKVNGLSADFTREFPPYSITALKLKTK